MGIEREYRHHDQPSAVEAEPGFVIVDGPGPVALTFTPQAAKETARRLIDMADRADRAAPDV